jgi:short-subunit dehydrogenase involved in D-alanine esterification of teichoic acids
MLMQCLRITETYPDVDCLFLNAGVQGTYDFSKPVEVDLKKFFSQFNTNFTSIVALTHAFLPFLQSKKTPTSLIL